jgi:6,7-dimethyl-8-ribityllumazine synthase
MTTFEGSQDGKGLRVGIVCSRFNEFIVNALLEGALRGLASHGVAESDIDIAWVPGAYEIPVTTKAMAVTGRYDTLVTLGAVIRGETAHFEYVAGPVADSIAQIQLVSLCLRLKTLNKLWSALVQAQETKAKKPQLAPLRWPTC